MAQLIWMPDFDILQQIHLLFHLLVVAPGSNQLLSTPVSAMTKSCGSSQFSYRRKYALEVTRQEGACVKEARCKFCKYFDQQVFLNNRKRPPRRIDQFRFAPTSCSSTLKSSMPSSGPSTSRYRSASRIRSSTQCSPVPTPCITTLTWRAMRST
jgi:hypothetical protein